MKRINEEQRVVEQMIRLYCRKKEHNKELCPECQELLQYATARLQRCKFGENKPTCKKCPIHCYRPKMKEKMREVMRSAGPRMILYHPVAAMKHIIREYKNDWIKTTKE
ncbi:MAG: nitrous oxide-stimulated promoter family protein [Prevotellaceae bacterium]|nr:nitrous oxide-stimulated promoter family protein [Prevotellaceae bacterium]